MVGVTFVGRNIIMWCVFDYSVVFLVTYIFIVLF